MHEGPMLFKGIMVRALLARTKTQTRRVVKPQPVNLAGPNFDGLWSDTIDPVTRYFACPYGQPGDRLWVRETWQFWEHSDYYTGESDVITGSLKEWGKPNDEEHAASWRNRVAYAADEQGGDGPWRPSIFMPRWASRITLEVESVRVERLNDIRETDAKAEGCDIECRYVGGRCNSGRCAEQHYRAGYRALWNSINLKPTPLYETDEASGKKIVVGYQSFPWSNADFDSRYPGAREQGRYRGKPLTVTANPWLWVITFRKL